VSEARERRSDGRPEQSRPRDRTGRPLPRGTTGVATTEEVLPGSVAEAIVSGCGRWSEQRYFEAHEFLEHAWKSAGTEEDRERWKGIIQVAVAGVHLQRENPRGASALLDRALRRLADAPEDWQGLAVGPVRARAVALRVELEAGRLPDADLGRLAP
jgi:hypothetical protein